MLKINCLELKNDIEVLTSLISEYEEIQLNLFNQIKDSCMNWQDGNSIEFEKELNLEKNETSLFLENLKDTKNVLDFIYDKYIELGKKISCDLNNKSTLTNYIIECEAQVNDIIREFNKVDNSFYYPEYQRILNQKEKIKKVRENLKNFKLSVTKIYDRINEIEKEIKERINKLDEIKINDFDYNLI